MPANGKKRIYLSLIHISVLDVTIQVNAGDYLCIVGENGSGKSTLIKGILGLLKPTGGTLTVAEELKKSGIGYLPQQTAAQRDFPAAVWEAVSYTHLDVYKRQHGVPPGGL